MSLDWNITKVANKDTVCFNYPEGEDGPRQLRQITENLIWATIAVDLGNITAKNIDEWLVRLQIVARVSGSDTYTSILRSDLENHIGLSTNVTTCTRAGFLRKMTRCLEREANASVRYATTEATSA